ncbi:hypothetical protein PMAYCL1PPCAC_23953, partial [Pristionchus mayeri]
MKNHEIKYLEDDTEPNIYEEEVNSVMMEERKGKEEMTELVKEVKERTEASQQLERDIRDIESIFLDLNHIVH